MSFDIGRMVVKDFLKFSSPCVETLVKELAEFNGNERRKVRLYYFMNGRKHESTLDGRHFFLRTSIEYSNPQLTVEEVQGIVAARLLEVCGNYFAQYGLGEVDRKDVDEICERLNEPPLGTIFPFLLNTDDVEPDRYSMNPLKESIVNSGQSAFPSASVKTVGLNIDQKFMRKYQGKLISRNEVELIGRHLENSKSYIDMVDAVKYEQLANLSEPFGINLCLYSMRMPLTVLEEETANDLLHHIIKEAHMDYESTKHVYACMGRSMKKRTTLLTIPHSEKGYGSKRAVRGKLYFEDTRLGRVKVTYRTTPLYPNAIDPNDVSIAVADDRFTIEGERFINYNFSETPSSPQFILYSLGSPEAAVIWHGIGAFGASQLVQSYTSTRRDCARSSLITNLKEEYGITVKVPLQYNLVPKKMWVHPIHDNIDSSIGCIKDLKDLAKIGMRMECLSNVKYVRR